MLRKLILWSDRTRNTQPLRRPSAQRARRRSPLRDTMLGLEFLETRDLLNASPPTLFMQEDQFFGEGFALEPAVPFRATFTDIRELPEDGQNFLYSIDWGDGSPVEANLTPMFMAKTPFGQNAGPGDPIVGWIEAFHTYATASSPLGYTVTVTLEDGLGGSDTETTQVDVYPVDWALAIGTPAESMATEGSPFSLTLPTSGSINKWRINWGDAIGEFLGSPASAIHTYADDMHFNVPEPTHRITAAVFKDDGIFYAGITNFVTVDDVPGVATISGDSNVDEDALYTLNLSNIDPGADPIQGWFIFWEGLSNLNAAEPIIGNPASVTHMYPTGGTSHAVVAWAFTDDGHQNVSNMLNVTVNDVPDEGVFLVGGTLQVITSSATNNIVTISQTNGNISVSATFNGSEPVVFSQSDVDDVNVSLGDGHDIVVVGSNILVPVTINGGGGNDLLVGGSGRSVLIGGAGNDVLWGGGGDDVLLGGDGNDDLFGGGGNDALVGGFGDDIVSGGTGRDLLIGSQDDDRLHGGNDEDILVGGYTTHDNDVDALDSIMAIWGSTDSFTSRVEALTNPGGLLENGVTVFDDDAQDIILGGAGRDLVFGDTNPADGVFDILALNPIQDVLVALV